MSTERVEGMIPVYNPSNPAQTTGRVKTKGADNP
jgi:hypothetical protein